jgi:hypothetical protein
MERLGIKTWDFNRDKNQLEVVLKDRKHLSRQEVGKMVELAAGDRIFELGLFAIGLFVHDDGTPTEGAAKLIPLPGSSLRLEEVFRALQATGDNYLIVRNAPSTEPSRHFKDPLVQIRSEKGEK